MENSIDSRLEAAQSACSLIIAACIVIPAVIAVCVLV